MPTYDTAAMVLITTADAFFAECWGHSAKPAKHSAKALPSAALGKGLSAKILSAKISLPSAKNRHSAKSLPGAKPALGKKNCRQHLTPALPSA